MITALMAAPDNLKVLGEAVLVATLAAWIGIGVAVEEGCLKVRIEDSGIGIAADDRAQQPQDRVAQHEAEHEVWSVDLTDEGGPGAREHQVQHEGLHQRATSSAARGTSTATSGRIVSTYDAGSSSCAAAFSASS